MTFTLKQVYAIGAAVAMVVGGGGYILDKAIEYRDMQKNAAVVPTLVETVEHLEETVEQLEGFRKFMERLMSVKNTSMGALDPDAFYDTSHTHDDGTTHDHP